MIFIKDNRDSLLVNALMSGQRKAVVDKVEFVLKPLKHDTYKNRLKEAEYRAKVLIKVLDNKD